MSNPKTKVVMTLCMVHEHPRVLLAMKKRGFGQGRWNGFGGKAQEGEGIEECARRELQEECSLIAGQLEKYALIDFDFVEGDKIVELHVFKVHDYEGEPQESEEMRPAWFQVDKIPYHEMWSSDCIWMPLFLEGKKLEGTIFFDKNDQVVGKDVRVVETVD
jgi:8-oxo-dGTP diphosphatase/2-hydroxy-dATP diphosphatase